jgi:hypothetical protein
MKKTFPLLSLLLISSFLLGACGSSADNASTIATSVALTVQAQDTSTPELPSATPADLVTVTALTASPATPTTAIASGSYADCMVASLVSENPPDGVIYKPGQTFLKTWHIQNNSTCAWNTSYKIIFWGSGNQMGSAYVYNFPQGLPASSSKPPTLPELSRANGNSKPPMARILAWDNIARLSGPRL